MASLLSEMITSAQDAKAFFTKESKVGDAVKGVITGVSVRQTRDFKTKKPVYWDDNTPQMQIVLILQTDLKDPADEKDDGARSVYVKWWGASRKEFAAAVLKAGKAEPEVGDDLMVKFVGTEKSKDPSLDDTKLFSYTYAAQ